MYTYTYMRYEVQRHARVAHTRTTQTRLRIKIDNIRDWAASYPHHPLNQPASTRTHIPTKSRMHVHTEYMPTYDVTVCYSAKQHTQFPIHPYRCDAQLNFPLPNSGE